MATTQSFELLGVSGGRDQNGICSVQVPYYAETFGDVFEVGAGGYGGLQETGRSFQANADGTFTVHITCEGAPLKSGQSLPGRDNPTYTMNSTFEEEAIEAHPKINEIVTKYGGTWKEGKVTFPPKMPADKSKNLTGLALLSATESNAKPNPMSGVEKYKKLSVQWEVAYAAGVIPSDVISRVGTVISNPPGNPPKLDGRTKWLVMPPTANKKGNLAEIKEVYFLLDQDIAPEIYKK